MLGSLYPAELEFNCLDERQLSAKADVHLRVDHARQTVEITEILDFYTEDFLAASPWLIAHINRYRDDLIRETYTVEFIDYD